MRKITLLIFSFLVLPCISFAQKLTFSYDAAGNQTERRWVCINCPPAGQMSADSLAAKVLDLKMEQIVPELSTERGIKVAPNPLKETLNVVWGAPEKVYLASIDVYNINGNKVFSGKYGPGSQQTQISFQHLPPGTYIMVGHYSDSKTETVKLIKI